MVKSAIMLGIVWLSGFLMGWVVQDYRNKRKYEMIKKLFKGGLHGK